MSTDNCGVMETAIKVVVVGGGGGGGGVGVGVGVVYFNINNELYEWI